MMEKMRTLGIVSLGDGVGILGSATCAIHCLVTPVLLVVGPVLPTSFALDESFHRMLLLIVLPASILSFGLGCWRHKDRRVLVLGALGLVGLTLPVIAPHGLIDEVTERWVTVGAAALLISAHLRNFRRCRDDACDPDSVCAQKGC